MTKMVLRAGLLALVVGLAGCDKQPGGQVVAVVGEDEITLRELRAEAQAPANATGPQVEAATAAALKQLVDRNVLADYARKQGLDRSPEYVARRRQLEQTLLAGLAIRKLSGTLPTPKPEEVQAFIDANPTLFAGRQRLNMTQIRIPRPADPAAVQALVQLQNMDAIAARLRQQNITFERGPAVLDTAAVDPAIGKQIAALPDGEVFDINRDGFTYLSAITGRSPVPVTPDAWPAAASAVLQRQTASEKVEAEVAKLRQSARIEYDAAYKPKVAAK